MERKWESRTLPRSSGQWKGDVKQGCPFQPHEDKRGRTRGQNTLLTYSLYSDAPPKYIQLRLQQSCRKISFYPTQATGAEVQIQEARRGAAGSAVHLYGLNQEGVQGSSKLLGDSWASRDLLLKQTWGQISSSISIVSAHDKGKPRLNRDSSTL